MGTCVCGATNYAAVALDEAQASRVHLVRTNFNIGRSGTGDVHNDDSGTGQVKLVSLVSHLCGVQEATAGGPGGRPPKSVTLTHTSPCPWPCTGLHPLTCTHTLAHGPSVPLAPQFTPLPLAPPPSPLTFYHALGLRPFTQHPPLYPSALVLTWSMELSDSSWVWSVDTVPRKPLSFVSFTSSPMENT